MNQKIKATRPKGRWVFFCPGCGCGHYFNSNPEQPGPCWSWNGLEDKFTISPSLMVQSANQHGPTICHSFIKDGMIQYLGDCTHSLKNQTVEIPSWESEDDWA